MKTGFLQGPEGEDSSKRLSGMILIFVGVVWFVVASIFMPIDRIELVKYVGGFLVSAGAGLLGFGTLAERINKNGNV